MRNPFSSLFEVRSAIGTSHALWEAIGRGARSVAGPTVNESTALNIGAVRTGVAIRAELFSTLPVDVVRKKPGQRGSESLPEHQVARVLSKPNSWQTRSEFLSMLEVHRLLRGNGYAWKNLTRDVVNKRLVTTELIPLHPDRVEVMDEDGDWGGPTRYKVTRRNGQAPIEVPAIEMLHVKNISTNGRTGRSFLSDMREVIGGAIATQDHANSLWSRDATPSVVLKHPSELGKEGRASLEESWEALYGQGKDKRRVAVLEEGMTMERVSLTPNDGQFLETRQDMRAEIAAELRIPPFMVGLSEKATTWGTGIEQLQIGLVVYTLTPTVTAYEQRFNVDLLDASPYEQVKFNVAAVLRGDLKSQGQFFWWMRQMGCFSANDILELLDRNPIPNGGDVYLQPTNMGPLGLDPFAGSKGNSE